MSAKRKPSMEPQPVTGDVWYYEAARSIGLVVWVTGLDGKRVATQFRIPAKMLEASLARMSPPPKNRGTR